MSTTATDASTSAGGGSPPQRKRSSRWDQTPVAPPAAASRWDQTPVAGAPPASTASTGSRWDQTPVAGGGGAPGTAPAAAAASRWDQTPVAPPASNSRWDQTPVGAAGTRWDATPAGPGAATPVGGLSNPALPATGAALRWQMELAARNAPLSDEDLDALLPSAGYTVLTPPASYAPPASHAARLLATPTPLPSSAPQYQLPTGATAASAGVTVLPAATDDLPFGKPEDYQFFGKLLNTVDEATLSADELRERRIMKLLLRIKSGSSAQRKVALKQLSDKAREFGAAPLFNQILPLLMSPSLEDQERHLLVKVIDRLLYRLDDLVRPHVHRILVVIEPLLIDGDYYARMEGREIISNLAKAAGLSTMIASMRPDIDHVDEYVRNTTARAFAVVANALGIQSMLPFLKAVCNSKKSWQARHTALKVVQQIAILMGCSILPHLTLLVQIVQPSLSDPAPKVKTIAALALAALASASAPYGIESFDDALPPLFRGIPLHHSKVLASFLKAIGCIIPLMEPNYASYYTGKAMIILIREFQSPDDEMKKIVLKVVEQCVSTDGVEPAYVRDEILPHFFRHFWVRRMAMDRRTSSQLVATTVALADKVGGADIVSKIVEDLKDENEPMRKMVMEAIEQVIANLGAASLDDRLVDLLIDGILYAFQEQTSDDNIVMLNGFATILSNIGIRARPFLPQIASIVKWRLTNRSPKVRQQAADLVARIAKVLKECGEDQILAHLGLVLDEYLGEEYPDVLGSILGGLNSIVSVIGMASMTPPIRDLLPRLSPILRNRHEKVQENCLNLVGRIADRGAEHVSAREWMRICFELIDMLKAQRKSIQRAAVSTFGYIAKAIGPQDVLVALLNNLKVQDRQNRVCTTVAIAIVAESCMPFTVLPALMNEYRIPELNVQNGVLKSLSFMFEYIGEMGKDYIYAVVTLLEDALIDRDMVHRQTAASVVQHLALGVYGLGCEDALVHLLNFVWPNVFETSPHVIRAVLGAIDGIRTSAGSTLILHYLLPGLFHPARRVRAIYWKIYNNAYIAHQDALVPAYPRLDEARYGRDHLDIIL